ncbi:MAG: DUF1993 domain-containing protein [Rickettsiales bacterium]|nr:DUF1993 domain-containing protein [Rickettsiales bacterium]
MTISMYKSSVPVFLHNLENLSNILKKAEQHAKDKKIDESVLINARLFPDMFALVRQVQIVSDIVKGAVARLSGLENPSFADTETTFADLQDRISKTAKFIKSFKAEQIDGCEEKVIKLKVGGNEMEFSGQNYLLNFALPNLYFHITVTYSILRHNGVEIGKGDFLGKIQ